ncbi:MAG: hypothetical protein ACJ744_01290 [Gaiellaceae bacterium]
MAEAVNVARRFSVAYLALAALLGIAIGTLVVLVERPAPTPPPPWSPWQPNEASRVARQQQIASHVGSQYHLNGGKRLVRVVVRDPDASPNPIRDVALARNLDPKQQSDVLGVVDSTKTAMYILCGDGPHCAIKEGKPSVARGTVLRREALELALYSFRYLDDTDSVVAFFPPQKGQDLNHVYFFAKTDFKDQLDAPLRFTLPQSKLHVPGSLAPHERRTINALTVPRQFRFALRRERGGANVLVLAPGS